jgi:hypothetical protein
MRTVMVVCLLVSSTACNDLAPPKPQPKAAPAPAPITTRPPPPPPTLPATTTTWSRAETDPTPSNWDAAGDALTAELADCTAGCFDLAKREVTARKKAIMATQKIYAAPEGDQPATPDPRISSLVEAMDHYVKYADPSDQDAAIYALAGANMMSEYRHNADAIARCEAILRNFRDTDIAVYAANELLDLLAKANRTADLRFWVTELLADSHFLDGKDALRETLVQLRTRLESPG